MHNLVRQAKEQSVAEISVNIVKGSSAQRRFRFCAGVSLKYDPLDYFYIPGLERPDGMGFLTPVFFSIEILPYFQTHPGYVVNFGSDTYGTIYTKDGGYISFGLTRAKHLIMWLGDLNDLTTRDLQMLAAHNIKSDHDIGSEFYEGQIEAHFTPLSQEQRIVRAQGELSGLMIKEFQGLRFLKMEKEAVGLLGDLKRPIYYTDEEFGNSMEVMTKLFIERIDGSQLKESLRPLLSPSELKDMAGLRELKLLQLWLSKRLGMGNADAVMKPLFVLYDLRVAYKHLLPEDRREELRQSSVSRLGLPSSATLEGIYTELTAALEVAFRDMSRAAEQATIEDLDA